MEHEFKLRSSLNDSKSKQFEQSVQGGWNALVNAVSFVVELSTKLIGYTTLNQLI